MAGIGNEQKRPEPHAYGRETANDTKRTGRKVPTGQPRVGHLSQPDAKEPETRGRIRDGITNRGPVR